MSDHCILTMFFLPPTLPHAFVWVWIGQELSVCASGTNPPANGVGQEGVESKSSLVERSVRPTNQFHSPSKNYQFSCEKITRLPFG